MLSQAVFLDRDGTINEDPGYLGDPEEVKLLPGVLDGLFKLKNSGFKLIVISNQSGIARGLISEKDVINVNSKINFLLNAKNIQIDAFYFCPFHPDINTEEECRCRKPSAAMVFQAADEHKIDISRSYLIGDSVQDIICGFNAGLKTILVKTGNGVESFSILQKENKLPSFVAENISDACNYIINNSTGA